MDLGIFFSPWKIKNIKKNSHQVRNASIFILDSSGNIGGEKESENQKTLPLKQLLNLSTKGHVGFLIFYLTFLWFI